jgi:hypothetical protein
MENIRQAPDALLERERAIMGGGDLVLVQSVAIAGGGWMLVYDYTSSLVLDGKRQRQRRVAVYGPESRSAHTSVIFATDWVEA